MAKRFKITNEQYKRALNEGIRLHEDDENTFSSETLEAAADELKNNPNAEVEFSGENETVNFSNSENPTEKTKYVNSESRIITKKQMQEARRKYMKEHSDFYTVKELLS